MSALNLSEEKITHRQQIVQLLRMAIDQRWQFSYVAVERKKLKTRPVVMLSVNVAEGTFSVDRSIEVSEQARSKPIMFRAQSGGISVIFKALVSDEEKQSESGRVLQVDLPYEVRCTQLRKSTRIDVQALKLEIGATLYLSMGFELQADLVDISTTGAQFKLEGDETERFKNLQMLEACKIGFSDDYILRCSLQALGIRFDPVLEVSFLRCQLLDLSVEDESTLDQYIEATLEKADPSTLVISS